MTANGMGVSGRIRAGALQGLVSLRASTKLLGPLDHAHASAAQLLQYSFGRKRLAHHWKFLIHTASVGSKLR